MKNITTTLKKIIFVIVNVITTFAMLIGGCAVISIGISGLIEASCVLLGTTAGTQIGIILYRLVIVAYYAIITLGGAEILHLPMVSIIKKIDTISGHMVSRMMAKLEKLF